MGLAVREKSGKVRGCVGDPDIGTSLRLELLAHPYSKYMQKLKVTADLQYFSNITNHETIRLQKIHKLE